MCRSHTDFTNLHAERDRVSEIRLGPQLQIFLLFPCQGKERHCGERFETGRCLESQIRGSPEGDYPLWWGPGGIPQQQIFLLFPCQGEGKHCGERFETGRCLESQIRGSPEGDYPLWWGPGGIPQQQIFLLFPCQGEGRHCGERFETGSVSPRSKGPLGRQRWQ